VLPPGSAKLLPPAWRNFMTDPHSEVKDFYPDEFAVDMDGCRNPWEGVTLIPFIDETRLLTAIHSVPGDRLSNQERNRNRNVQADWLFEYDPNNEDTYNIAQGFTTFADGSSLSLAAEGADNAANPAVTYIPNTTLFPALRKCCSRAGPFVVPAIPAEPAWSDDALRATLTKLNDDDARMLNIYYGAADTARAARFIGEGRFLPVALPGAVRPTVGFPSLYFLPGCAGSVATTKVNLFGRDSLKPSLAVSCSMDYTVTYVDGPRVASLFPVSSRVFVDYPHLREALVVRVQDDSTVWDIPPSDSGKVYGRVPTRTSCFNAFMKLYFLNFELK